MTHSLKTWPEYFKAVKSGDKTFEIRKDDRQFMVGDIIELLEYEPCKLCGGTLKIRDYIDWVYCDCTTFKNPGGRYTGRKIQKTITYITSFNQKPGYVVIGFK